MKYSFIFIVIMFLTSFINDGGNVIEHIRNHHITSNDSVQYIIRNYATLLSGKGGEESWVFIHRSINNDLTTYDYYYKLIIKTKNKFKYRDIQFIIRYDELCDSSEIIGVIIDGYTYNFEKFPFPQFLKIVLNYKE